MIDLTIANPNPFDSFLCVCFSKRLNKVVLHSVPVLSLLLDIVSVRPVTEMAIDPASYYV